MDDYISKPISIEEIQEVIRRWGPANQNTQSVSKRPAAEDIMDWTMVESLKNLDVGDEAGNLLMDLVNIFQTEFQTNFEKLRTAIKNQDAETIKNLAHKLKGAAANLGAKGVAKLSYNLETKGKNKDLSGVEELAEALKKMMLYTMDEFDTYFQAINKEIKITLKLD
jgi:HPt (histidine-containing phosphotransfer) domain-containing protein